jgi:hypothetical protein
MKSLPLTVILIFLSSLADAADFDLAARATNEFATDLQQKLAARENLCLSPFSIENALAMTFAGAEGETRTEMARVLHFPGEGETIHASFASLNLALTEMTKTTATIAAESKKRGGPTEPITLTLANRLFAQTGYDFRDSFRQLIGRFYGAPFAVVDFKKNPDEERQRIFLGGGANTQSHPRSDSRWRTQCADEIGAGECHLSKGAVAIRFLRVRDQAGTISSEGRRSYQRSDDDQSCIARIFQGRWIYSGRAPLRRRRAPVPDLVT